jgi:hypothetical protein
VKEEAITGKIAKSLTCEQCRTSTLLDETSVEELRKIVQASDLAPQDRRKSNLSQSTNAPAERNPTPQKTAAAAAAASYQNFNEKPAATGNKPPSKTQNAGYGLTPTHGSQGNLNASGALLK